jgi:hypothetical protein
MSEKKKEQEQEHNECRCGAHAGSFGHPAVFYSDSLPVVNL